MSEIRYEVIFKRLDGSGLFIFDADSMGSPITAGAYGLSLPPPTESKRWALDKEAGSYWLRYCLAQVEAGNMTQTFSVSVIEVPPPLPELTPAALRDLLRIGGGS